MRILPKAICKPFTVEKEQTILNSRGGQSKAWTPDGNFDGVIIDSTPSHRESEKQPQHPYTHQIVHDGLSKAQVGDRLVYNGRYFYVVEMENPADMGYVTVYRCEERAGV